MVALLHEANEAFAEASQQRQSMNQTLTAAVLFADVEGSTALYERLGDASAIVMPLDSRFAISGSAMPPHCRASAPVWRA